MIRHLAWIKLGRGYTVHTDTELRLNSMIRPQEGRLVVGFRNCGIWHQQVVLGMWAALLGHCNM